MLITEEILRHLVTVLEDDGTSVSEEDLAPAAVPAGESRTDDEADAMAETDETAAPMASATMKLSRTRPTMLPATRPRPRSRRRPSRTRAHDRW